MTPSGAALSGHKRLTRLSGRSLATTVVVIVVAGSLIIYFGFVGPSNPSAPARPAPVHTQSFTTLPAAPVTHPSFVLASAKKHKSKAKSKSKSKPKSNSSPSPMTIQIADGVSLTLASGWSVNGQAAASGGNAAYVFLDRSNPAAEFDDFVLGQDQGSPTQILQTAVSEYFSTSSGFSDFQATGNVSTATIQGGQNFDQDADVSFTASIVNNQQSIPIEGEAWCLDSSSTSLAAVIFVYTDQGDFTQQVGNDMVKMLDSMV